MMPEIKIFTRAYRPFRFGPPHDPVGTTVEALGPFEVGKNFSVYVAVSPLTGNTHIAEAETGALVGDTIEQVRTDMAEADMAVVAKQMETARKLRERVDWLDPDKFWEMLSRAKPLRVEDAPAKPAQVDQPIRKARNEPRKTPSRSRARR